MNGNDIGNEYRFEKRMKWIINYLNNIFEQQIKNEKVKDECIFKFQI